jgi:hypothetical protein
MAIALAALDANSITTETESDAADELTESSENLFLRNLSQLIANSEQTTRENQLSITEVPSNPLPQFGYFLPIAVTPKLRQKRLMNCGFFSGENNLKISLNLTNYHDSKLVLPGRLENLFYFFFFRPHFRRRKSNKLMFTFHT